MLIVVESVSATTHEETEMAKTSPVHVVPHGDGWAAARLALS
jgi:hypothetical protein